MSVSDCYKDVLAPGKNFGCPFKIVGISASKQHAEDGAHGSSNGCVQPSKYALCERPKEAAIYSNNLLEDVRLRFSATLRKYTKIRMQGQISRNAQKHGGWLLCPNRLPGNASTGGMVPGQLSVDSSGSQLDELALATPPAYGLATCCTGPDSSSSPSENTSGCCGDAVGAAAAWAGFAGGEAGRGGEGDTSAGVLQSKQAPAVRMQHGRSDMLSDKQMQRNGRQRVDFAEAIHSLSHLVAVPGALVAEDGVAAVADSLGRVFSGCKPAA